MVSQRSLLALFACLGFAVMCLGSTGAAPAGLCTCRYAGESYAVGTCVCMKQPGGRTQTTCCGMVLNNTSWEFTGGDCPISEIEPNERSSRIIAEKGLDAASKIAVTRFIPFTSLWRQDLSGHRF